MNGIWFIEPGYAQAQAPLIKAIMNGGQFPKTNTIKKGKYAAVISPTGDQSYIDSKSNKFETADEGSVAIFCVSGPIMKDDGECGEPGTARMCEAIDEAANNSNIIGAVFIFDSPGGSVSGTEEFANCIKDFNKPKIGIVEDMCASAAYWAISQCDEVYACNSTSRIGSIGTMVSFADMQPYWESQGVKFHEIYADASVDKNKDFIEARKGNYDLVKETLNGINNIFIASVTGARKGLNKKETLTGKMFLAADAQAVGLIDGMMCEEDAVQKVRDVAAKANKGSNNASTNINQNNTEMKIGAKFTALVAMLSSAFSGFKADETVLTEEHLTKINSIIPELDALQAEKTAWVAEKAALEIEKGTLTAEKETLATDNARLATLHGKATEAPVNPVVDERSEEDKATEAALAELSHNKALNEIPLFK